MNNQDRNRLKAAIDLIQKSILIVEEIRDSEQDKYDNLSEGLQSSSTGQKLEDSISELDNAISQLEDAIQTIVSL
ncbi:MAG: hypothetical protein SFU91_12145 [Chloroherpetonaceae bacterium]|nr:hypothetical protein [Chloroherpetonaceae bacterium]